MVVPDRVRTTRLLLRSWRADDAGRLLPVLETNQAHLGPWIPQRVAEPVPITALSVRLTGFAADFTAAREWRYGLFTPDDTVLVGEVGLFPRTAEGRVPFAEADRAEIGYWVRADLTGQGLATEAAQAVLTLASTLPAFAHVEIRCDARNAPSAAVPRRLGFVLTTTVVERAVAPDEPPVALQVWTYSLGRRPSVAYV